MGNREDKLPKWAQLELQKLRRRVGELEKAVQFANTPTKTQLVAEGPPAFKQIYLSEESRVTWYVATKDGKYASLTVQRSAEGISVHGSMLRIAIHPRVSNSVHITLEDHYP